MRRLDEQEEAVKRKMEEDEPRLAGTAKESSPAPACGFNV